MLFRYSGEEAERYGKRLSGAEHYSGHYRVNSGIEKQSGSWPGAVSGSLSVSPLKN